MVDEQTQATPMGVQTSEAIDKIAAAMSKAQASITTVVAAEVAKVKMKAGGEFSYKYAHLHAVLDVCRGPLAENSLAVVQAPRAGDGLVVVTTIIMHSSGQFISSDLAMRPDAFTPQAIGSAITYARRYALSAMMGVAPEDDDGKAAQPKGNGSQQGSRDKPPYTPAGNPPPANTPSDKPDLGKAKAALSNAPDLDTLNRYDHAVPGRFAGDEKALAELRAMGNDRYYSLLPPAMETMDMTDCRKWLAWVETRGFHEPEYKQLTAVIGMRIEELEQQAAAT